VSFNAQGEWLDDGAEYVHVIEWCPMCQPDGVPEPWTPKYCGLHYVRFEGDCDAGVNEGAFLSGSAEAGGMENSTFCDLLHRKRA
jgi:hypothetical protein